MSLTLTRSFARALSDDPAGRCLCVDPCDQKLVGSVFKCNAKYSFDRALKIPQGDVLASIRANKLGGSAVKCKYSSASRRTPRPARIQARAAQEEPRDLRERA